MAHAVADDPAARVSHGPQAGWFADPAQAAGYLQPEMRLVDDSPPRMDYRVWIGRGPTMLGVGWSASALDPIELPAGGARQVPGTLIFGVRYQLSERSRLYFDTHAGRVTPEGLARSGRGLDLGVEYAPALPAAAGWARGTLLRVQLNASSSLALRLRGGRLGLALRAAF
jgi:hypothetical protein